MQKYFLRMALFLLSWFFITAITYATENKLGVKGIYLTQYTLENTATLKYLIKNAKAAGIDTFVVDLEIVSKKYQKNLQLLKDSGIKYVARIIMFPNGGTPEIINNPALWQKKYRLVKQAVDWGASQIQLDYIRFNTKQKPSPENAKKIFSIISWYKSKLAEQKIPLQVDVFGIASFGESKYIGQNIKMFSESVDAVCPMVYPSHYVPFKQHFQQPYDTIYDSLTHLKSLFGAQAVPMKVYAYIELSNYHFRMSKAETLDYIYEQIEAVRDAQADGWYAWSPHNRYDNLFSVLSEDMGKEPAKEVKEVAKPAEKVADKTETTGAVKEQVEKKADKRSWFARMFSRK